MEKRYELYCLTDPLFYDSPHRGQAGVSDFDIASRPLPEGWRRIGHGEWRINVPPDISIPAQGWKIHVSACKENADSVLNKVWEYCVPRQIWFKFLHGPLALHMRNAKYAPRGGSGKLITIYPPDEAACEVILRELGERLEGEPGPYILSDLRYGNGPLHVRYGAFAERHCRDAGGELVPAIEDPSGHLVPDRRAPVFTVPPWVTLPAFLAPHLAARNAVNAADLPYRVEEALHFSNGGGVYLGVDKRTGERVVLKEARPHAGLDAEGADAVTRLRREHDILRRLSGLRAAPEVRGFFELGGHQFLVEEYIDGAPLNTFYADRYPLLSAEPDPAKAADYTRWALHICDGVQRAVEAVHERGVVVNDLHMFNIMVRPDDTVTLIDFEAAAYIGEGRRPAIGNPGFVAPRDRTGFGIDAYSLACVRLAIFLPLTMLLAVDRGKATEIAAVIAEHFPVEPEFLDQAVRDIAGPPAAEGSTARPDPAARPGSPAEHGSPAGPGGQPTGRQPGGKQPAGSVDGAPDQPRRIPDLRDWQLTRQDLVRAILASATPGRDDRLFPGDVDQFAVPGGGLGLSHGAAGVLYALSEAAGMRIPVYEDWLIARIARPPEGMRLGLYDGLIGVAYLLQHLGHREAALRTADACLAERWERLGHGLHGGLSGFALALLFLADTTGEAGLRAAGLRAADIVAASMAKWKKRGDPRPAGLMNGASGPALLFVRMYERTGDTGFLDLAGTALEADLDRCVTGSEESLQVDDGWRTLPYLGKGSVGIGLVLDGYLAHRGSTGTAGTARFAGAAAAIRKAACSAYYAQSGLFNGRAGMILYLAQNQALGGPAGDLAQHQALGGPPGEPQLSAQVRRLAWHAIRYGDGLAFPGDQLFRLSMDLGTGTAGVLLGLAAAFSPARVSLPFLATDLPGRPSQGLEEALSFRR